MIASWIILVLLLPDTVLDICVILLYLLHLSLFFTMNWVGLGIQESREIQGELSFSGTQLNTRLTMNCEHQTPWLVRDG